MTNYNDISKAILEKLKPKILEQVSKSNVFYDRYKGGGGMANDETGTVTQTIGYVSPYGDAQAKGYASITVSGMNVKPDQFQVADYGTWTTNSTATCTPASQNWYYPAGEGLLVQASPPPVQASPPPEPPAEIAPVEKPKGRMIKLGKKR